MVESGLSSDGSPATAGRLCRGYIGRSQFFLLNN
jgi:hypothetical protein